MYYRGVKFKIRPWGHKLFLVKIMSLFHKKLKAEYIQNDDRWWHYLLYFLIIVGFSSITIVPSFCLNISGETNDSQSGFASLLGFVLFLAGVYIAYSIYWIQKLRRDIEYTKAKASYYEFAWERTKRDAVSRGCKMWYDKPFCEKCWRKSGNFWQLHCNDDKQVDIYQNVCSHY